MLVVIHLTAMAVVAFSKDPTTPFKDLVEDISAGM